MPIKAFGGWEISDEQISFCLSHALAHGHANCFMQVQFPRADSEEHGVMCVVDLFNPDIPTKTVTNDAEFVVESAYKMMMKQCGRSMPIIYRDSEGCWDELMHVEGNFATFRTLSTINVAEAILRCLALHERDSSQDVSQ